MDASKKQINDIFNGNRILEIPFFQRAYVWQEQQWERMLADFVTVSKINKPYFLGALILKQKATATEQSVGDIRLLIDGQQRMTTLSILFKVLSLKQDKPKEFFGTFTVGEDDEFFAINHNHMDIESYENVLKRTNLSPINKQDSISRAFNFFVTSPELENIDIQKIKNNILFVGIDLSENEDEQQIFDTINSLGVRLTTAELLKNYFFNRNQLAQYEEYWKNVFEVDDDANDYWDTEITTGRRRRSLIDVFFGALIQIKVQDPELKVSTEDKESYSKLENLFDSYKSLIEKYNLDKAAFLEEVKEYALLFRSTFSPTVVEKELTYKVGVERVNSIIFGLETTTIIPYLLFLRRNQGEEAEVREVCGFLESYVMRRMVCRSVTKNYNNLFKDEFIGNRLLTVQEIRDHISKKADKQDAMPSDEEIANGFHDSKLINKQAAGILYFIESRIRHFEKHSTGLLGLSKYSLEHLMPKKWENNWAASDDVDVEWRRQKLLCLGNLAIITQSLNASVRDSSWSKKLTGNNPEVGNGNGLKAYASGLQTLTDYLELPEWNEATIERRSADLAAHAIRIWPA